MGTNVSDEILFEAQLRNHYIKFLRKCREVYMRKSIKAIVCAVSALVICVAPILPSFSGISASVGITAEAASFVSQNGSEVIFDANQISTSVSSFKRTNITLNGTTQFSRENVQVFEKQYVEFSIKLPYDAQKNKNVLQSVTIEVTSELDHEYKHFEDVPLVSYSCTDDANQIYTCSCEFLSYGNSYSANIYIPRAYRKTTEVKEIKITGNSFDYYRIMATPPTGEKIYAVMPKKDANGSYLNQDKIARWSKDLCLLANSLKELTGSSMDTIFIIPNDYTPKPAEVFACSSNYTWDKIGASSNNMNDKYDLITLGTGAIKLERDMIKSINTSSSTGAINKYLTHEMGHAYANFSGDNFGPDFNYSCIEARAKEGLATADENYTNVRALTAMNNCTNLKNYKIKDNAKLLSIASVYDSGDTTFTFYFNQVLIKKIGFDRLEKFYSGASVRWNSDTNIKFANYLAGSTGLYPYNIPIITASNANQYKNYLMFVNGLRGLYGYNFASTGGNDYLKEFIKNIKADFKVSGYSGGVSFIRDMAVYFLGADLKGGKM